MTEEKLRLVLTFPLFSESNVPGLSVQHRISPDGFTAFLHYLHGVSKTRSSRTSVQSWEPARMGFHGHDRCFGRHLKHSPAAKKQNEEQVPHRKGVPAPSWSHSHSQRPSWQGLVTLLAWGRAFSTARSFEADIGASAAESQAQPAPPRNIEGPWKKQTYHDHLTPSPNTIRPAPFRTPTRSVGTTPPHTHTHLSSSSSRPCS